MPDLGEILFPVADAQEMLDVIANSSNLEDQLEPVSTAVTLVREMLGNFDDVDSAKALWNENVANAVANSRDLVNKPMPGLVAYWEGPAFRAYSAHSELVDERIGNLQDMVEDVKNALTDVLETITNQYQAALDALLALIDTVLTLASGAGRVLSGNADAALEAISTFLDAVEKYFSQAIESISDHKVFIADIKGAVATLQIPGTAYSSGAIEDPARWHLRPDV